MGEIADYYSPGGGAPECSYGCDEYTCVHDVEYKRKENKRMYKKNTAPLEKELIVVELSGRSEYGPYLKANGQFYGLNEPLTEVDFQKGEAYTILFKSGKNGKKYIAQLVASEANASSAPAASPPSSGIAKAPAPSAEKAKATYAEAEDKKGKRILWQGVVQAVAQSPVFAGTDEAAFTASVKKSAEELVAFINEKAV